MRLITEVDATEVLIPEDGGITLNGCLHESRRLWFAGRLPLAMAQALLEVRVVLKMTMSRNEV
ncbi:MAG: hypothetical protein ACRD6N_13455 [Pyrinomonadaceae bacterium]